MATSGRDSDDRRRDIERALAELGARHWNTRQEAAKRLAEEERQAALIAATKHTAVALAKDGVLVNTIAPGSVLHAGGGWERFQNENSTEAVGEFIEQNLPMGRFGWPEPVGDLVAFLASERAGLITGACIVVDGGQSYSMI